MYCCCSIDNSSPDPPPSTSPPPPPPLPSPPHTHTYTAMYQLVSRGITFNRGESEFTLTSLPPSHPLLLTPLPSSHSPHFTLPPFPLLLPFLSFTPSFHSLPPHSLPLSIASRVCMLTNHLAMKCNYLRKIAELEILLVCFEESL